MNIYKTFMQQRSLMILKRKKIDLFTCNHG